MFLQYFSGLDLTDESSQIYFNFKFLKFSIDPFSITFEF